MNDADTSLDQRAREMQTRWAIEHPDDKKPTVKPHKQAGKRKKKWWELF